MKRFFLYENERLNIKYMTALSNMFELLQLHSNQTTFLEAKSHLNALKWNSSEKLSKVSAHNTVVSSDTKTQIT